MCHEIDDHEIDDICPKCKSKGFLHGFKFHNDRYYCENCGYNKDKYPEEMKARLL